MRPIGLADLQQIAPYAWEIPRSFRNDMRVAARLYATREMVEHLMQEPALAMPDIHQGYGFPIGGVVATRAADGVISPGGVGYDINCGVRLLASRAQYPEVREHLAALATQIQRDVPTGIGHKGRITLDDRAMDDVLNTGLRWAIGAGYARERGRDQLGTLGSGNHFLEVQRVAHIHDSARAATFGLFEDQVTILIHTGSRGLGHQTCTEYVRLMDQVMAQYGITLPDRELACAPFVSPEGQAYFRAMAAAANFAWCNRQLITHAVRGAWRRILGRDEDLAVVYDVSHNIAKLEEHGGVACVVHRKGATRAFGPGSEGIPERYRSTGQPVFVPGSMGTASYVLAGTGVAMSETFGSACHGAGRLMSRHKAKQTIDYNRLRQQLHDMGIEVRAASAKGLIEEAPAAYKDVEQVVDVMAATGVTVTVARLVPIAVVKG